MDSNREHGARPSRSRCGAAAIRTGAGARWNGPDEGARLRRAVRSCHANLDKNGDHGASARLRAGRALDRWEGSRGRGGQAIPSHRGPRPQSSTSPLQAHGPRPGAWPSPGRCRPGRYSPMAEYWWLGAKVSTGPRPTRSYITRLGVGGVGWHLSPCNETTRWPFPC
jgi:hypothetical protein